MYPTLHHQDIMVIQRVGYTPAQGDVVVLRKGFLPGGGNRQAGDCRGRPGSGN